MSAITLDQRKQVLDDKLTSREKVSDLKRDNFTLEEVNLENQK